jgi:uncharacterized protein (TIGR02421 family)
MQAELPPRDDGKSSPGGPWRSYKERLARLAQRLVEAQRPIRILNAIKWDPSVFERFRDSKWRKLPPVDADYYRTVPLGFDPDATITEMRAIAAQVRLDLGDDAIGKIVSETALQFVDAAEMLRARGTKRFYELSRRLYGSPKDTFADDVTQIRDVALDLYDILTHLDEKALGPQPARDIPAERGVEILNQRLKSYFEEDSIRVILDDGIVADAAAGSDYIKVRQGAMFSERDLKLLEVHEGWVHVATSINGQRQPVARWLAIGSPRVASSQEGLAALLEVLTLCSHPSRARRLNDRVLAVDKAEDGASFLDVFEWFRTEGYDEETCFWSTQRVFRGGVLAGGAPFTKDIVYTKGIVSSYNFLRAAIAAGRPDLIAWLFVGKTEFEDLPVLVARAHEGIVQPPRYVPPMFRDMNGLAIWLGISTFWGRLRSQALQLHYDKLFAGTGTR